MTKQSDMTRKAAERIIHNAWRWMKDPNHWVKEWRHAWEDESGTTNVERSAACRTCLLGAVERASGDTLAHDVWYLVAKATPPALTRKPTMDQVDAWFEEMLANLERVENSHE